jgi:hypothetical protein
MTTEQQRFAGDRYQRLAQGAAILENDPAVLDAPFPFNGSGLRAFIAAIVAQRILDDLSDCDANLVSMLLLLDFPFVSRRTAWYSQDVLPDEESERRRIGNGRPVSEKAVAKALVAAVEVANATIPIPSAG